MKKSILTGILVLLVIFSFALSNKPKEEKANKEQEEKVSQSQNEETVEINNIDREKNIMPKKLVYSELPEDYPKELAELFQFYYDTVTIISDFDYEPSNYYDQFYNQKLKEYLDSIPLSKKIHLRYLVWLARNTIPLYFAEYLSINSKHNINNISEDKIISLSILPKKFWTGNLKQISPNTPSPSHINLSLARSIKKEYSDKLKILLHNTIDIFIKCEIIQEKFVERKWKPDNYDTFPMHYIRVKVLDAVGERFTDKEITIAISYSPGSSKKSLVIIQKGKEYMIPLSAIFSKSNFDDTFTFNGEVVNDNLRYTTPITRIYPLIDNKYHLYYHIEDYNIYGLGKDLVAYDEFKSVVEKEIEFLKTFDTVENENFK